MNIDIGNWIKCLFKDSILLKSVRDYFKLENI